MLISGHAGIGADDKVNLRLGKPDVFVALSQTAFRWANTYARNIKIYFIPNGIDLKMFNPSIKPENLNLAKPLVLCVGALLQYKRIVLVIKAMAKMEKATLLVIGDGPEKECLENLGRKLLGDRFMPHNECAPSGYGWILQNC